MIGRRHARYADDVGAYLLGALADDERARFEKHLSRCDECRQAVAELAPGVDALQHSVDPVEPPTELKTSIMAAVRAEPRQAEAVVPSRPRRAASPLARFRVRPRLAALAASAFIALGFAGGALIGSLDDDGGTRTIAAEVDAERQPAASARLVVPQNGRGATVLRATGMQQPPPGRVYTVWLKRGERLDAVSLLAVDREGSAAAALPGPVEGADAVLVTREPEGGSERPSEAPVVSVDLTG